MSEISKVVIRNKIYNPSELSIKIETLKEEKEAKSIAELVTHQNIKDIINNIYNETIVQQNLEESHLFNSYLKVVNSGVEDENFKIAYRVREDMAIRITDHIYVCRIADDFIADSKRIIPWYCMESEIYIADTWWEEDDEILNDFITLSYMDFIVKYKMY